MRMIIGILQCDSVRQEFQPQFGNYPSMFQTLLSSVDPSLQFKIYDVQKGVYPSDIHECHAYVTTGSKVSVYESHNWILKLQQFIFSLYQQKIKFIGVCFGHQLLAQALGGKTEKSGKGWGVGVQSLDILQQTDWMLPKLDKLNLIASHQDQVSKLAEGTTVLAGNTFCPYALCQIGESCLTVQGHPEFDKVYSETLMRFRKKAIGEEAFQQGLLSLNYGTDEKIFAMWMLQFFSS